MKRTKRQTRVADREKINLRTNPGLVLQAAVVMARMKAPFRMNDAGRLRSFALCMDRAIWAAEQAVKELKLASTEAFWSAQALQSKQTETNKPKE